ncbi:unnamed protein product, partial [Sphacelaria rigidula]
GCITRDTSAEETSRHHHHHHLQGCICNGLQGAGCRPIRQPAGFTLLKAQQRVRHGTRCTALSSWPMHGAPQKTLIMVRLGRKGIHFFFQGCASWP